MAVSLTTPVTGSAQTGFTSPTYTNGAVQAPDTNAKRYQVTALGGTQVGVTVHSLGSPFQMTVWQPKNPRILGTANPVTGIISNVPNNTYKVVVDKGVTILSGQPIKVGHLECEIVVPAGSDTNDIANLRAMISFGIGGLQQLSAGLGDTAGSGSL